MAIYSLQIKTVSRSTGRSVVAAAAYRAAEQMVDDRLGIVWDFTRKSGVLHSEIMTPAGAPDWALDRESLWNAAEAAEDKSTRWQTATVGRDIILALPHELTHEQRLAAAREFAGALIARYGVAVDFALHEPDRHGDDRNYHGHFLLTTRRLGPSGFGAKTRELDGFRNGAKEVEAIRQLWERIGNRALEQAGLDIRIDCRSYVDQGLDREPTMHLGPSASEMERRGESTDLGDRNRAAKTRNAERERLAGERDIASAQIIDLALERARREEERELRAAVRTRSPPRILDTLTDKRATFSRADLNRVLGKVILDPRERAALTNQILALPDVVGLRETAEAPISRYTTRAVLNDERAILDEAASLAARRAGVLSTAQIDAALAARPAFTAEQQAAFRHATGASSLAVIAGESGAGKSTVLATVRDAYQAAGYRVVGMSWTHLVVQDMRRAGYAPAETVASELRRLETGSERWNDRTVLIVDEAAMLSTRHLASLIHRASETGAKLILAGDDEQLSSIERGGLFGAIRKENGAAELHEVVRVSDAEQKRAFNLMHQHRYLPALSIFASQGAVHWKGRQEEAFDALVERWAKDSAGDPGKTRFVFAYTNADVAELNAALREARKAEGVLGPDHLLETAHGPLPFAISDRVQFTGTAPQRDFQNAGLINGAAGEIRAIEDDRVTVVLDGRPGGRDRLVSFVVGPDQAAGEMNQLRHGYAGTIYKGQGRTLDATYLYHSQHWRAASSYVALTRHRENVALFVATETARDLGQLARQMARVDDCRAASQFVPDHDPPSEVRARRTASGGGSRELDPETRAILREARETEERQARERDLDRGWERSR